MRQPSCPAIVALALLVGPFAAVMAATQAESENRAADREALAEVLAEYFRLGEPDARAKLVPEIRRLAEDSAQAVAEALPELTLWSDPAASEGEFDVAVGSSSTFHATYRLPRDYTTKRRWPLLLTIRKAPRRLTFGDGWAERPAFPVWLPASATESFVHVSYYTSTEATFAKSGMLVEEFRTALREARRRFRIDSDRIFLHGEWEGGEAAWQVAVFQPHLFAGVILVASCPDLPYPMETYPRIVAGNLARLPMLVAVPEKSKPEQGAEDAGDRSEASASSSATPALPDEHPLDRLLVAGRAMELLAEETGAPWKVVRYSLEQSLRESVVAGESADALARLLGRTRGTPGSTLARVFRFPSQGDAGWVRQTQFLGAVWEAEAISIMQRTARGAEAGESFTGSAVTEKTAAVTARIDGQAMDLDTRHCGGVDVLLRPGQVDWSEPVIVRINGARRHEGVVEPDIAVMVEEAYRDWEFQHPPWARLSFSIRGDGAGKGTRP